MSLYDPLFKAPDVIAPQAETANPRSLEEQALIPPAGTSLRPVDVGAHKERIPVLFDPRTRTVYPVRQ